MTEFKGKAFDRVEVQEIDKVELMEIDIVGIKQFNKIKKQFDRVAQNFSKFMRQCLIYMIKSFIDLIV